MRYRGSRPPRSQRKSQRVPAQRATPDRRRGHLGTITMAASFLLDTIPEEDSRSTERRQREVIKRAARAMNRMIEDLLDVTRVESGRGGPDTGR